MSVVLEKVVVAATVLECSCLRKALNHEESEIHNETCLSLSVINFQSFTQYIKVKADMISGLFFFMLRGLC